MSKYITLKELSRDLGMDKSNLRKFILSRNIKPVRIRTANSRNQETLAVLAEEAELIRTMRDSAGFEKGDIVSDNNGYGYFYIIKLVPDLDPRRVKLGFATNVESRLRDHKTAAPTAEILAYWSCKKTWEVAAMDSITRADCKLIGGEVFTCEDTNELLNRGNEFFGVMPKIGGGDCDKGN